MKRISVVLDAELLRGVDAAAKRARISRSALIRNALREHIRELHIQEMERRDREGYMRFPETPNREWEEVASWPED